MPEGIEHARPVLLLISAIGSLRLCLTGLAMDRCRAKALREGEAACHAPLSPLATVGARRAA
jgi:hypothetical protein